MAAPIHAERYPLHPLHAVFLAAALPLFIGALLSDIAYAVSYQVQWKNFASWLIPFGLILTGIALVWGAIDLVRLRRRNPLTLLYLLALLAVCLLGFINALVHAKDAWGSMPDGLILSVVVAALAGFATWLGFSTLRTTGAAR